MTDTVSQSGLGIALILPWLCGCIWTHWLLRQSGRCNAAIVLGQGFFVGTFFTTLVIRLWDALGFAVSFRGIAALVFCVCVLGVVLHRLRPAPVAPRETAESVPTWHIVVSLLLFALIAWRHVTLLQELLLRPLYAWDAWMNWAPKAIVWFHHGALVDFVDAEYWLRQGGAAYTLGNEQANNYPITVPLLQLWCMLGVGTWDHSAIYLPWLLAPIALALALYGHLRLAGVPLLLAVIASYLLLSLPYLNVHTVLAGYADIWLASAFTVTVCALYEWQQSRHWAYAILWVYLALLCTQLKVPGIVLGLIAVACGVRVWLDLKPKLEFSLLGAVGILLALAMTAGISIDIPWLGHIGMDHRAIEIGRWWHFALEYHSLGTSFLETLFVMLNWNLLWYLLMPWVLYRLYCGRSMNLPVEVLAVLGALVFVTSIFVFTEQ